ncbi:phenylalanyl-tRNA synthetase beta chain [Clostridium tetanomorphum]|uniref:Phenylalanine--tRNA ligase beta subunit n=1 Tax=Clostridium tetanomorphum TaxID=1553 RepID=A0A923ECT1_CLOTT|nr:phenylalanine--tRNA ligase subunit beta [Clostridium tetanomorphum]KAJ50758.1 phenylalanyl-tRNA ligase subunit beta [Clostridium tetanomorphum DSM 665]MBC2399531.1 phenylalanine--tRNA ligase subunit beta [Clostridium tetanomorphum]MBP1866556.1 phenylalanyl-tRNA synthetase beta chain [Clostridium tetanomorphum]NRS85821.1 phenylalanyl-tRNA synthetase beta chain [Clostridium tetanomorphum]NRZ96171.1 phenylalanyl-tRNA synthetase beta chain [Clostridium tetanomorphum]
MKVPVKWLKDYVNIDISAEKLADRLTLSGSKVEEVISSGDDIQNVVTGKILEIKSHPDAEKLVVCQINVGKDEPIQIVTGANNMKEEDIVPVALHGSTLPSGVKIKKGKLRGIASNGMMCSEEELGIAGDKEVHGLMILPKDTPIGKDIKEVLGLDNSIIDFEITSNRPDCLSVVGMARETAATLGTSYSMPNLGYECLCKENINNELKVEVKDSLCRRYMARGVKNIKIEESPSWIKERLLEAGVRPINNIVDITNFVMLELGQPMHAFDAREITSNKIVVERAKDGEKFTTLDEAERQLDSNMLCIKDGKRTVALAGIMGGLNSEVKDDTTSIIFECANFDGTNVRVSSKNLGLRTEASARFEKDLDPNLVQIAMDRACSLIVELNVGQIMEGTIDVYNEKIIEHTLEVNTNWINRFLGTDISKENMREYLNRLELKTEIKDDILNITVPTFRCDINIKEDVAEEIARIYGYNNIPTTILNSSSEKGGKSKKQNLDDNVIEALTGSGLNQSISYSFVSPKVFDQILLPADSVLRNVVKIKNPLGEDYSIMRTTTIPSILEALGRNFSRNNEEARLFEIGKIYLPKDDENKLPEERNIITIGLYGNVDYLDLKGVVENVIEHLGIQGSIFQRESESSAFHPGKTAKLYIKKDLIGVLGEIHPDVADNYGIEERCYVAELNLDILYNHSNLDRKYKVLPKFPAVSRDIALLVDDEILVQDIEDIIVKQGGKMVEKVKLFDIYKGKQIPEGKKSVAYSILYRLENKTLTDEEVNKVHDKIVRTLENRLGAQLR